MQPTSLGGRLAQTATKIESAPTPQRRSLQRRSAGRITLRVVADAMAVSTCLFLSSVIRFELLSTSPAADLDYALITVLATPAWLLVFWLYGLYEPRQVLSPVNEFKQVFHGVVGGVVLIFVADSLFDLNLARGWALLAMACGLVVVGGERLVIRKTLHFLRRRGGDATRTIVLGANHEARSIARTLRREAWLGYRILGFVDDRLPKGEMVESKNVVLGNTAQIKDLIEERQATLVLVAATAFDSTRLNRLLWELQDVDVDIQITSGTLDLLASRMTVQSVAGVPLLYVRRTGMDTLQRSVKRIIDVVGAAAGLVLLSPLLLFMALWIRMDSEGVPSSGRSGSDATASRLRV